MGALKACAALATASALALLTSPALAQKQILDCYSSRILFRN